MAVIDCLEDPDETLKRKTLDLLYRMTNPVNVEFIVAKLTTFLREATDVFLRTELVSRITQCAERYNIYMRSYLKTYMIFRYTYIYYSHLMYATKRADA